MFKVILLACVVAYAYASAAKQGVAFLKGNVNGKITFKLADGGVKLEGRLQGLPTGKHGFHIHEKGDISNDCAAVGGHFNPTNKQHGAPAAVVRHVGDLGNIVADNSKVATVNIVDKLIALEGANSVIGRTLVIHANEDDFGKGGQDDSLTVGHSGKPIACAVIGVL